MYIYVGPPTPGYRRGFVLTVNTLRPRRNGDHFADDNVKCIFLNKNTRITIEISLKFVHKDLINNMPALVQIMAWCRPGDKPLSEPMMVRLPIYASLGLNELMKNEGCCIGMHHMSTALTLSDKTFTWGHDLGICANNAAITGNYSSEYANM